MMQDYNILAELMGILGRKWVVPLLFFLLIYEQATFTRLKKHLKVTSRALSKKLKLLEAFGLIEKILIDNPRKFAYRLSDKGRNISNAISALAANN